MTRDVLRNVVLACCLLMLMAAASRCPAAVEGTPMEDEFKYYWIDAELVSLDASLSLSSYRGGGQLGGSPGATLGTSTPNSNISIALLVEKDRLYADLTIEEQDNTQTAKAKKQRFDLTNLRPQVVDLGTTKEGANYHLNLVPSVKTVPTRSKSFSEAADDLYRLRFHSSRVMLNDEQYIGRMLASDAQLFSMDICDVASIEFSLHQLKDAEPWGRLQNGRITIHHPEGTTIEIDNTTNGNDARLVGNGPYVVWVRWKEPQNTAAEYRAQLSAYRDQIKNDEVATSDDTLAIIEKELARKPGPWVISSGAREPSKNELVDDE
jgi:hypothetical protein